MMKKVCLDIVKPISKTKWELIDQLQLVQHTIKKFIKKKIQVNINNRVYTI
jgi:hypothetical protein